MLIDRGDVYSVASVKKTLIYSVSGNKVVHLHIRTQEENPVKVTRPGIVPDLVLRDACTTRRRAFDVLYAANEQELVRAIWKGDLRYSLQEGKWETVPGSDYTLVGSRIETVWRRTPQHQLTELKRFFQVHWEDDCIMLVETVPIEKECILMLPDSHKGKEEEYWKLAHFPIGRILYRLRVAEDTVLWVEEGEVPVGARFSFEGEPRKIGCSSFIVKKIEGETAEVLKKLEVERERFRDLEYFEIKRGHFIAYKGDEVFLAKKIRE